MVRIAADDSLGMTWTGADYTFDDSVAAGWIDGTLAGTGIGNVAVGGITAGNIEQVLGAGAKAIAVCSAVTEATDPTAACRQLKEKITAFSR